jgi:isocitrate lyase
MINWNDIQVEQQIAQERYQTIIEARQVKKALSAYKPGQLEKQSRCGHTLAWLGGQLISLGHSLQGSGNASTSQC